MLTRPVTIRPAQASDAAAACEVLRRSISLCCTLDHQDDATRLANWLANKTEANTERWIAASGIALVAESAGAIVGFANCASDGELKLLYLLPETRFTGTGKALLQAIETWAIAAGLQQLTLDSTATAHDFYLRNGFLDQGAASAYLGMPNFSMTKQLENKSCEQTRI